MTKHKGKVLIGTVVSAKMKDTVVVEVNGVVGDPKYRKYLKRTSRFKAHDAGNTKKESEQVTIIECRPMSRDKRFRIA